MQNGTTLLINESEIELDLSDVTALREHVLQLAEAVHNDVLTLVKAKELIQDFGSIEEAIASKDA